MPNAADFFAAFGMTFVASSQPAGGCVVAVQAARLVTPALWFGSALDQRQIDAGGVSRFHRRQFSAITAAVVMV